MDERAKTMTTPRGKRRVRLRRIEREGRQPPGLMRNRSFQGKFTRHGRIRRERQGRRT